jgi:hypothetical protein
MRRGTAIAVAALALGLAAAPAQASFHLMKISEVFPGTPAAPDKAFIELRMYAGGQNFVSGHSVTVHDATGAVVETVPMTDKVDNGENNRSILLGDIDVTNRDFEANIGTLVDRTGGAVCFADASPPDCVAWGNFAVPMTFPGTVGTPVAPAGIPGLDAAGSSITRDISRGCPTFLEPLDDTDSSAADFVVTDVETPQSNADPIGNVACGGGGGGGEAPNTEITKAPKKKTPKTKAKFKFAASEPNSTFECKLDKGKFKACKSPRKYKRLDQGKHRFQVRAVAPDETPDPTPAKHAWKIKR